MYFNKYLKRMFYTLLLVIRRVLNFIFQRFGTFCLFHLHMRVDILHTYTTICFYLSPRMLQSVRRHSAAVLTGNVSGMQEIHPAIYRLLERNQK